MPKKLALIIFALSLTMLPRIANAEFVVSVDANDLSFAGPGTHEVDLFLSFRDAGVDRIDTLNGMQIGITNAPNATVRQGNVPSGITGQFFPAFNVNTGNTFGWGGLGEFAVPTDPGVLLTTLTFDVTDNQDFTIGLNFVQATRNSVVIDGGTAGNVGIVLVPLSFTVSSATAIPEPSSLAFLVAAGMVCGVRRRKRR